MTTAEKVTKAILQEILVRAVEADLEADEFQDTVFAMNNYMTALDANGVHLGYTIVADLSDLITVPAGAIQGMIKNIAVVMAPQFSAVVSPALVAEAKFGMDAMRKLGVTIDPMVHPSTMPIGSGNERDFNGARFYPGRDENILTETGQSIGLESNT